ncbi:MAG: cytochrome c oxidase subunit 2 [Alphaproteobacteria bacterium MarineAlpha4_Bin2]|nr:MAG: cytochrome c oxidase subunit 2 [Alphaproteobacteria bacterium MarineAlpha4_Bin2]
MDVGEYRVNKLFVTVTVLMSTVFAGQATASEPSPWQIGLQPPVTPTAVMINDFHDALNIIITLITVFVLALLLYACFRFRESRNPTPSKTTHHTVIEILWTVIPIVILVGIAIPSMKLLYFADRVEDADMTLKVVGHQWYWEYQYPDHGNFSFDANMIPEDELKPGQKRLMDTDNPVVLPVGKKVRLLFASVDVIHNWSMSSFGVKVDTTPGRLNETWVQIDKAGTYYGFCSELCGVNHAYMPIMVQAVPPPQFEAWVKKAQKEFARVEQPEAPAGQSAKETVKIAARDLSK